MKWWTARALGCCQLSHVARYSYRCHPAPPRQDPLGLSCSWVWFPSVIPCLFLTLLCFREVRVGCDLCRLYFKDLWVTWSLSGFSQWGHWWAGVRGTGGHFPFILCTSSCRSTNFSIVIFPFFINLLYFFPLLHYGRVLWNTQYQRRAKVIHSLY